MDTQTILSTLGIESLNASAADCQTGWSATNDNDTVASINPSTGEVIGHYTPSTEADYERIMQSAEKAFDKWRTLPAPLRGEIVREMGEALRAKKDALGSLVTMEMGKLKSEGDGEVQEMIDMADFAVGQSRMLYGKTMHSERPEHRMYEQWHPLGICGVISAFNFPVAVWSWNAFIAAICGNVTVWKPSPKTPLTAIAVQKICDDVMAKHNMPGIFCLFIDGPDNKLAEKFVKDARVKKMSFTGSSEVGRQVGTEVASRMSKCLLELSGNNALIIDETANLEHAIPAAVFGAVGTTGQRCTTTRRLLVHESLYDTVLEKMIGAYAQVKIGNPLNADTLMGPLIDQGSVDKYLATVAAAKAQGGVVRFGGEVTELEGTEKGGFFVKPTIIEATNDLEIVQTETFAPIVYVMKFKTLDEAIAMQNHSRFGLSSSIFTTNVQNAEKFLSAAGSDCGIANVNIGTSGAEIGGAFGGEKETGGGREAGSDAWKAYMRRQTNTIFWGNKPTLAQGITFNLDG